MMNRIRQETHKQKTARQMAEATIGFTILIGLITFCVLAICYDKRSIKPNNSPSQQWIELKRWGEHIFERKW